MQVRALSVLVLSTVLEIMMALLMVLAGLGLVVAEPPASVVNSTLRANEPRHLASCGVAGAVDCGVCKCTDRIACPWCDGSGGPASIGSAGPSNSPAPAPASTHTSGSNGFCPSNLVSCGVCTCTTRSSCQYCNGYGGPASISSSGSGSGSSSGSSGSSSVSGSGSSSISGSGSVSGAVSAGHRVSVPFAALLALPFAFSLRM